MIGCENLSNRHAAKQRQAQFSNRPEIRSTNTLCDDLDCTE